jgi:2-oxoglutarate ferredoxin oxidoreductase subunit gamma
MALTEIRFGGFGGQGVILAGMIFGRAATIYDNKHVTLTQSFGPEARGSACSVQLIVSPEPILYPYISNSDILMVMSQEAYTKFVPTLRPGGMLLYEEELVKIDDAAAAVRCYGIPATRFAEELGKRLVLNVIMVGFVTAVTGLTSGDAVQKAVRDMVPRGTENLNLSAFKKGYEFGLSLVGSATSAA